GREHVGHEAELLHALGEIGPHLGVEIGLRPDIERHYACLLHHPASPGSPEAFGPVGAIVNGQSPALSNLACGFTTSGFARQGRERQWLSTPKPRQAVSSARCRRRSERDRRPRCSRRCSTPATGFPGSKACRPTGSPATPARPWS